MISENEFFRNITLKICGHLKVEEGLKACIKYLSQHIPADRLYLERHDHGPDEMRPLARASTETCERLGMLLHLSEHARIAMAQKKKEAHEGSFSGAIILNNPHEEPAAYFLLEALGEPTSSILWLPLIVEGNHMGALILLAYGTDRFNDDHAKLFTTLREPFFTAMSNAIKHEEVVRLKDRLTDDNRQLQRELLHITGDEIIGADFGLREVLKQVQQVAPTESPVLLTGETGVGKDVIANAIHLGSPRRDGPFIPVNCGAIPDSLLDSELFGHEKGAFTGALSKKRGRFERADRGTILLDEIGEMPLEAQVRLLRVLQHREIERLGGTNRIPVDIRIIAATNKDLPESVKSGAFREDLFFRLNVFPISIPPLRERVSDIPALVQHFLDRKAKELKIGETPTLAASAMDDLMAYNWPGNVRELENIVERAMIVHRGKPLRFNDLNAASTGETPGVLQAYQQTDNLDTMIAQHITRVLNKAGGKIHGPGGAGELLGVNPNSLRYKMQKLGIAFKKGGRGKKK